MVADNPLSILGIPLFVLYRAFGDTGDGEVSPAGLESVRRIAEGTFRTLSKEFHPDRPTGDSTIMARIGQAIEELRDPDALRYYLTELVAESDISAEREARPTVASTQTASPTYDSLARSLAFIDHFRLLALRKPCSFLSILNKSCLSLVNVTGTDSATVQVATIVDFDALHDDVSDHSFGFSDGRWRVKPVSGHGRSATDKWQPLHLHTATESVHIVGVVRYPADRGSAQSASTTAVAGSDNRKLSPDWIEPGNAWFVSRMQRITVNEFMDRTDTAADYGLVLMRSGRFAVAGKARARRTI